MQEHEKYMRRCLELAQLGAGNVSPNPMVGAVIVHQDQIIGEGYHQRYGAAHAEVNAIHDVLEKFLKAEELLKNCELYVSLEPCAHFGKTPPCSDLIIRHQISKVIVGCRDPFDLVDGRGIEKMRNAGIEVIEDVLKKECESLNKRFFTRVRLQRPYIILKWAETADGFFAPKEDEQRWITSQASKILSHRWRSEEDAILVGKRTALIDNPELNVREWKGRNPLRIVLDRNLDLPSTLHLFDQSQDTIVFNTKKTEIQGRTKYLEIEDWDNLLPQLIAYQLYLMDIQSVIVEGGAKTIQLFLNAGLWDEARVFKSVQEWSEGLKAPVLAADPDEEHASGPDRLLITYNRL
ncbi:MAG TPA: bifunctional diaminohydroxyphosphoribosylaminopyrimidine deaminase/5-amino-6-(5-phosphoribosylamino)uracil reductase RibD [Sphingobacteriaceae bacterium]|nr:bifunctional diaminohydroxyphosphoribosylaminopyrimidine deaminase/5-amino-6-(5-phosphoribosylamino)uracil reductase RibD [Sphingobacteriaceae bacterium]